jgi:hypothetical protein
MDDTTVYDLEARLSGDCDSATLLRLLTVLTARASEVIELTFDSGAAGGAVVRGVVSHARARPESLQAWLERLVNVVEARVSPRDPAGRVDTPRDERSTGLST